jgi:hypothetical protein
MLKRLGICYTRPEWNGERALRLLRNWFSERRDLRRHPRDDLEPAAGLGSILTCCRLGVDLDLVPDLGWCGPASGLWECGVVLAGVKAKPCGWLRVAYGPP